MKNRMRRFLTILGPGLITGASDDDPSGISTYSIAGASTGLSMLWIVLLMTPMMAVIQGMCARIAMVEGVGLAKTMKRRLAPWALWSLCGAVVVANTINAGADLEGMAAAARLVFGLPLYAWIAIFGLAVSGVTVYCSYRRFSDVVKWLTLALFAYVITAFVVHPHWPAVFSHLFVPQLHFDATWLTTLVAVLGTTITPYLFFWQAALEVEEEKQLGRTSEKARKGATKKEISEMHVDVNSGMIFSNLVAFFIVVTTASTLGARGMSHIASAQDAARALEPLAGRFAELLFALGMVGTGLLAIPALVGSSAYVASEALGFRTGLDAPPKRAPRFYGVLIAGVVVAMAIAFFKVNPITALFYSAVINGVVAVPLVAVIVVFASNKAKMGRWSASMPARAWGWLTVVVMTLAAIGMFALSSHE